MQRLAVAVRLRNVRGTLYENVLHLGDTMMALLNYTIYFFLKKKEKRNLFATIAIETIIFVITLIIVASAQEH